MGENVAVDAGVDERRREQLTDSSIVLWQYYSDFFAHVAMGKSKVNSAVQGVPSLSQSRRRENVRMTFVKRLRFIDRD
jgi:hypothetical protein